MLIFQEMVTTHFTKRYRNKDFNKLTVLSGEKRFTYQISSVFSITFKPNFPDFRKDHKRIRCLVKATLRMFADIIKNIRVFEIFSKMHSYQQTSVIDILFSSPVTFTQSFQDNEYIMN